MGTLWSPSKPGSILTPPEFCEVRNSPFITVRLFRNSGISITGEVDIFAPFLSYASIHTATIESEDPTNI